MTKLAAFNFQDWIEEHRHLLKPPVGNKKIYDDQDFIIFIVGGPNTRKDYHLNDTDEFFYILEGTFTMRLLFDDGPQDVVAPAGTAFVVPKGIWHKPGAPDGAKALYLTPGETLWSEADDPRAD